MGKHRARLAAYIILEQDGKVLLARRFNTGYADGMYQMPAGHVEANEYPSEAAVREAKEELGIDIAPEDLEFVHASYRINTVDDVGDYVDFFFRAKKWSGEPVNAEPEKCDEILWVPIDNVSGNTVEIFKEILEYLKKEALFSEIGRKEIT